jgi:predicted AAA+ superfamily ATPase
MQLKDAHRFDLLDEALYQDLLVDPSLFRSELATLPSETWVVVDEVQRIPSLVNEVHRQIEERGLRFALLGSSARKLKTAGPNLLAGRAVRKLMFPFVPAELGDDFVLNDVLRFGSIPVVCMAPDPAATLEAYVQMYLREEIRAEALVRNLPGFSRFLAVAGLFHGQVINVSAIARDAGTARTTVEGYLEILEDTLLATRLHGFEAKLRARERKLAKLYWVDPGVARQVQKKRGEVSPEERGALMEGFVLGLLRAHRETSDLYDDVHYWAPTQAKNIEVDFLLARQGEHLAIEVKSSARYNTTMLKGLRAIQDLPTLVRSILLYGGDRSFVTSEGIEVWPMARFSEALSLGTLWP